VCESESAREREIVCERDAFLSVPLYLEIISRSLALKLSLAGLSKCRMCIGRAGQELETDGAHGAELFVGRDGALWLAVANFGDRFRPDTPHTPTYTLSPRPSTLNPPHIYTLSPKPTPSAPNLNPQPSNPDFRR
jgi:hypothetical protein